MKSWLYVLGSLNNETIPSLAFYGPKLSSHKKGYDLQLHNYYAAASAAQSSSSNMLLKHELLFCSLLAN